MDLTFLVHDVHDRLYGPEPTLKCAELGGHPTNASCDKSSHEEERKEVLAGQFTFLHEVGPFENHQGDGPKQKQDDETREGPSPKGTFHGQGFDLAGVLAVFPTLHPFVGVTLDAHNGSEHVLHNDVGRGHLVLRALGEFSDESAKHNGRHNHHRDGAQHPKRQFHREVAQGHDSPHDQNQPTEQLGEGDRENVLDGGDVR